jgi:hypothetical protein
LNFALKITVKLVNGHKQVYVINETMRAELDFIHQALQDSGKDFEVPIGLVIPRTPMTSLYGDSSLRACSEYSATLQVWWSLSFPDEIVQRTLLHLKDNKGKTFTFISINCLEYATIIINYCTAITALLDSDITNDLHPVVLCVTDNVSAKNWTMHPCKKSIIGQALARFFCGLLIGSNVGINAKWISTAANKIADNISMIKKSDSSIPSSFPYNFAKLQQNYLS